SRVNRKLPHEPRIRFRISATNSACRFFLPFRGLCMCFHLKIRFSPNRKSKADSRQTARPREPAFYTENPKPDPPKLGRPNLGFLKTNRVDLSQPDRLAFPARLINRQNQLDRSPRFRAGD